MTRVWKTEGGTWGPCIRRQGALVVSGAGSLCREERHLVQDKALKMVVAQGWRFLETGLARSYLETSSHLVRGNIVTEALGVREAWQWKKDSFLSISVPS